MNLFNGMSTAQIKSAVLAFILFGFFATLEASSLYAFFVTSRPRRGRVRTASLWYIASGLVFFMCMITTVWAAPAEKSFIDADSQSDPGHFFAGDRFGKVTLGIAFAVVGLVLMGVGAVHARRQRERAPDAGLQSG